MQQLLKKDGAMFKSFLSIYFVAVLMLWIKTYLVEVLQFDLNVEGILQNFLLFINPLGAIMVFLSISFLFKGKRRYTALIVVYMFLSILLYSNAVYYRFFSDFITIPTLFQTQNFGDLGGSILSLLKWYDLFHLLDIVILFYIRFSKRIPKETNRIGFKQSIVIVAAAFAILMGNLVLAEIDRPQLLSRGFDRSYIVKYLGMYNYTIYDSVETIQATSERTLADSDDVTEILNYTRSNYAAPNAQYFGKAEGMNVVYLHLESMQQFLINYKLNGEEVTPFLNALVNDKEVTYFDNFYHQTAQGKTSDAEFMLENSLFGLPQGSAYITKGQNTYQSAPAILKGQGYTSAVFHGNNGSFWNRNVIYKEFGYDNFFDASHYDTSAEKEMAEYGLLDKPFFKQSEEMLSNLKQPFYTKFITVANHFPYKMDQDLTTIDKAATGDTSVDNYFQTARYADEALADFFKYLKKSGLYDNTMIVMYGDHYGISDNHNKAMAQIIGKEITEIENADLQRVPLLIRVPGVEGGINHTYGGQIDLLPTVLHLLGVDTQQYLQLGTDLFSKDHNELVAFRKGDYVSPTIYSINQKYYDKKTGLLLEEGDSRLEEAIKMKADVEEKLKHSDEVVNGDLLRFYTPESFTPVNIADYNYTKDSATQEEAK